ncbi:PTS cellobiose transporter subunit IIC [Aureibacillus halotolerans]|uniref:Permease IIC component n=1 Tax=Aureibacillus halotolerans TaxID=1508390 RepID=A0A4R6TWQ1_9BACI|nr:PTS cellobiose transporter subunit IIC [Aureibacillus halotolerans]TDQ37686.1 PTS system lichenan oligosaccharide-specific IIC component (Lac family) [Aureibacillus halotolerans]
MSKVQNFLEDRVAPFAGRIGQIKQLVAIRDGIAFIMPLIIIGSIALILNSLPIQATWYVNLMNEGGWAERLGLIVNGTFGLIGLLAAFTIAYSLAKQYSLDGLSVGLLSLAAYVFCTPSIQSTDNALGIPLDLMGSKGLFVAIVIGIISTEIFRFVIKKNLVIKLPAGVPPAVGKSFTALIPGFFIIVFFAAVTWILGETSIGSVHNLVQTVLGNPLSMLGGTIFGAFIYELLISGFWLTGIHCGNIMGGILNPIWMQQMDENRLALQAGEALPHILTQPFFDIFVHMGGAGTLVALAICLFIFSKSQQNKSIGRIGITPSLFNIGEPLMFGVPVVLNPIMFIPFILAPIVMVLTTYFAMATGIVPKTNGVSVPWTMPPIISGYLATGSIKGSIMQIVNLIIAILIYYPFFKAMDKQFVREEKKEEINQ